ncbi:MAG: DUF2298 domain-containing protein [Chloroflexota bacterium]
MINQFFSWYIIVQIITVVALPLTTTFLQNLPGRGYAFAKSMGILLVSLILWLGTSYGLMRNERGGAWLALILVALLSLYAMRQLIRQINASQVGSSAKNRSIIGRLFAHLPSVRYMVACELIFLLAFAAWAYVRAHDPAADHTEQPMDLMFMNGIWHSPTYPPRDPWLSGYAISYYYFGYWMLTTLARLAGLTPAVAYNVGQACWWGLLLLGSFGVAYNLVAFSLIAPSGRQLSPSKDSLSTSSGESWSAYLGGLMGAMAVGMTSNLMGQLEWLYANGYSIDRLANWLSVRDFPANANVTNKWYIDSGWWWWRSARVIEDLNLVGDRIEVIDEFPMFSYVLGDNHPHVMAMPFVLLVVAVALSMFARSYSAKYQGAAPTSPRSISWLTKLSGLMPLGAVGLVLTVAAAGALIFLNTWDFPPYWLLLMMVGFTTIWLQTRGTSERGRSEKARDAEESNEPELPDNISPASQTLLSVLGQSGLYGLLILVGALLLFLPYFLTAQSQAGGILPNFFFPTRLTQFLVMFGPFLPALVALIVHAWQEHSVDPGKLITIGILVYGLPIIWLAATMMGATSFDLGREALDRVMLPPDLSGHWAAMIQRWTSQSGTFLVVGLLVSLILAMIWTRLASISIEHIESKKNEQARDQRRLGVTFFVLLLAAIGLLLIYAPEFVYLKDNFGTRMNTVFKFYYQAWLLLGISSAYVIGASWHRPFTQKSGWIAPTMSFVSLLIIVSGLIYPVAGAYSKTNGFASTPSFDATDFVARYSPNEAAALAWIRENTPFSAMVLEAKGQSYRSDFNRVSTMTGRPTLLGWDGHESQWRGQAFGEMALGRAEAIERVYRSGSSTEITQTLIGWEIDYVYVGPKERSEYQLTTRQEERLAAVMDLVFESGDVRVYARR